MGSARGSQDAAAQATRPPPLCEEGGGWPVLRAGELHGEGRREVHGPCWRPSILSRLPARRLVELQHSRRALPRDLVRLHDVRAADLFEQAGAPWMAGQRHLVATLDPAGVEAQA